ncbi:Ribosomal protein lysine methyltransferase [Taxawa tesnikishii (nom. ined.)]|nr:Ribosomal protein lysine methyltransferase [Dothideales sp. JES 119]
MIDPRAAVLEITVGNQDFTVVQSPTVLNSARQGGTTGAVVWKVTPRFAEWIASANNVFFQHGILSADATILELGSGIAGILPALVARLVGRFIATDQRYALKLLNENIQTNRITTTGKRSRKTKQIDPPQGNIEILSLDWETDDVHSLLKSQDASRGVDAIVACDCIYNYALIRPFTQTCIDVCKMRSEAEPESPTVCIIAQQLRQPDVFEEWLKIFNKHFQVWRLPDSLLSADLQEGSGFVVHAGVLKIEDSTS